MKFYVNKIGSPLEIGGYFCEDSLEDVLRILGRTVGDVMPFVCYQLPDDYHITNDRSFLKDLIFLRAFSAEEFKPYFVPFKCD